METRDRILDAAAQVFAEQGYRASRMQVIAQQAGLSRAAVYKHFPSKEALLLALNDRVIADTREVGLALLRGAGSATERLERWLFDALSSPWRQHAIRVVVIEETQETLLHDQGATMTVVGEVAVALEQVLAEGLASGEFRADLRPEQTAYTLQALIMGLHRNHVSKRLVFPILEPDAIAATVRLLLTGIIT